MLWGLIAPTIAFIAWFWPDKEEVEEAIALEKRP
jgi:hypothetical protein